MEYVMSPEWLDRAAGTSGDPFRTIQHVVGALAAGDVLAVRGGSYVENVQVTKVDTATALICIRSHDGDAACVARAEPVDVEGDLAAFRTLNNLEWRPAIDTHPDTHPDEYVSERVFATGQSTGVRHGAFVDREPYTRLINYLSLFDLCAEKQPSAGCR